MTTIASKPNDTPNEYVARYGNREFRYHLCYLPALRKPSIRVHVHPNGRVQVDAPESADLGEIKAAVQRRARWVLKHIDEIDERKRHVRPRQWVSGECMRYLGRRYVLKLLPAEQGRKTTCKLIGGQLRVQGRDLTTERTQKAVRQWYRERAAQVFERRLALMVDRLPWTNQSPAWRLVEMQTQWGSCSPDGDLLLNPHLIKAPTRAIDYVLLHELCHLVEHNHSAKFYSLLDCYLPEWRSVKEKLDGEAELFLSG